MKTKTKSGLLLIGTAAVIATITIWHDFSTVKLEEAGLAVVAQAEFAEGATLAVINLPTKLSIPGIGVNAAVEHLGVTKSGNMAAPAGFANVSWYKYGTVPGETGSAVMAGHDNGIYVRGVFRRLGDLKAGDNVYVTKENGEKLHFRVIEKTIYPYDKAPLQKIFNRKDGAYLNLITCTGEWNEAIGSSDHRIVVYTELVK